MKVKELIEALMDCDPERTVILSKDAEGNRYSPLEVVHHDGRYLADSTWSGDCLHPDDWSDYPEAEPVVLLEPVN